MMNFHQSDALGGALEGAKFYDEEQQRLLTQQKTLEEIMRATQTREHEGALQPLLRQQQADVNAQAPEVLRGKKLTNDATEQKIKREDAENYVKDTVTMIGGPGFEDTMYQKYPQFRGHPIEKMARAAVAHDNAFESPGGAVEKMLAKISQTPATIEQRQREDALSARNRETLAASDKRNQDSIASREKIAQAKIESNQLLSEHKAAREQAAREGKPMTMSQAEAAAIQKIHTAMRSGDQAALDQANSEFRVFVDARVEANLAKSYEERHATWTRQKNLGMPVGPEPRRGAEGAGTATPPGTQPKTAADPNARKAPSGRGATVGPTPVKTSEAPASQTPGMLAQAGNAVSEALIPAANAAPPQQESPLVSQIPPTFAPVQQPQQAPPMQMPNPGMAQPGPGPIPPRPPGNPRMGTSPVDFPRVQPQEQMAMDQQSLQIKEQELAQFVQILKQAPKNHPKYAMMENLVKMLSREIAGMKQQRGL